MPSEQIGTTPENEDAALLARAHDIVGLLRRAVELKFSIIASPEQLREIIRLLEEVRIEMKPRKPND